MSKSRLEHINPSIGTRMFNLFGVLSTLHKLNMGGPQICSPLSYRIPQSRLSMAGDRLSPNPLHLMWLDGRKIFKVDDLFKDNFQECIDSPCDFIIISLVFSIGMSDHRNYIIINGGQAYRIEPYGHGETRDDDMDQQLKELFKSYGIEYISHSELDGFRDKGLQTIDKNDGVYEIIFPGYCNTYVFVYIE